MVTLMDRDIHRWRVLSIEWTLIFWVSFDFWRYAATS